MLIHNARTVNENRQLETDLFIRNGRIERIGPARSDVCADRIIDAAGRIVLPGMIDAHAHFREPGLEHKGNMHTESRAAAAGGVTSVMDMPNTLPPTVTRDALVEKQRRAAESSCVNYAFYLGAARDNLDEIKQADPKSVCGVKVYMGSSTGDMLLDQPDRLEALFRECPLPLVAHCEDTPTINANLERATQRYGDDIPPAAHADIRSAEACVRSTRTALELAAEYPVDLHIAHLSTAEEIECLSQARVRGRVTSEACVHHLFFSDRDYADQGHRIKCNPAIKTAEDRDALVRALADGRITTAATDHAPHTLEEKQRPYLQAPSGMPLIQYALPVLLELCKRGALTLERVVEASAHAPADRFGIRDRGYLREGYWADLVMVDVNQPMTVRRENVLSLCGWSPFEGHTFPASVTHTIVSGQLMYADGAIIDAPRGRPLEFDR